MCVVSYDEGTSVGREVTEGCRVSSETRRRNPGVPGTGSDEWTTRQIRDW